LFITITIDDDNFVMCNIENFLLKFRYASETSAHSLLISERLEETQNALG